MLDDDEIEAGVKIAKKAMIFAMFTNDNRHTTTAEELWIALHVLFGATVVGRLQGKLRIDHPLDSV